MSKLDIYLLDSLNIQYEWISISKPRTYSELEKYISQKIKNLSKNIEKFIYRNRQEVYINQNHKYKDVNDILFIRDNDRNKINENDNNDNNNNNIKRSKYDIIMNKIPYKQQEKLDMKFNCCSCLTTIKYENPYLCYGCQKIFHEKCLRAWDNKCKSENNIFHCPYCRNELPIEKWKKKLDHEENRKDFAELIDKVFKDKLNNNLINNIILIKEKKIYELMQNKKKLSDLLKNFKNYADKSISVFKDIINQINSIHSLLKFEKNNKLNDLIQISLPSNLEKINDMKNLLNEEFNLLKNKLSRSNIQSNNNKKIYLNNVLIIKKESEISFTKHKKHNELNNSDIHATFGTNDYNSFKQKNKNISNEHDNDINEDVPKFLTESKVQEIINMSNLPPTFGSANINNNKQDKSRISLEVNNQLNNNYDFNQIDLNQDRYSLPNEPNKFQFPGMSTISEKTEENQAEDFPQYFQNDQYSANQYIPEKYLNELNNFQGTDINFTQNELNANNNNNDDRSKVIFENINYNSNIEFNNDNQIDIENYMSPNNIYNPNNQQIIIDNEIKNINGNQDYGPQNNYEVLKKDKIAKNAKEEKNIFNIVDLNQ